jgi:Transposase, Mutator family
MEPTGAGSETKALGSVVQIDEGKIQAHLDQVVRSTVEETLNALLDAEADQLCGARRYERSEGRKDTRAGSYERQLLTKAGEVSLRVPKLRSLPFETAIIERYRRRESSVEEALVEMYLAGVSVRRVEYITQALWGTRHCRTYSSTLSATEHFCPVWPKRSELVISGSARKTPRHPARLFSARLGIKKSSLFKLHFFAMYLQ